MGLRRGVRKEKKMAARCFRGCGRGEEGRQNGAPWRRVGARPGCLRRSGGKGRNRQRPQLTPFLFPLIHKMSVFVAFRKLFEGENCVIFSCPVRGGAT